MSTVDDMSGTYSGAVAGYDEVWDAELKKNGYCIICGIVVSRHYSVKIRDRQQRYQVTVCTSCFKELVAKFEKTR